MAILEKATTQNSRTVQNEFYDRAKTFFEQLQHFDSTTTGQEDAEVQLGKKVSKEVEAFSSGLFDQLFGPKANESEPESTRMKRAALAEAYAKCAAASETGRLTSLASILERWLDNERSGPVRDTIRRTLALLAPNTR